MTCFNDSSQLRLALETSSRLWKQACWPVHRWTSVRHATHAAQGRANGPKNGPGKRLGAKKTGDEFVIPGNIIFRQRGTHWFPGENVGIGRDHTLFALQSGYVKYYKDPELHPERKYIGVVFDKCQSLPSSPYSPRRRRIGMIAVPRSDNAKVIQFTAKPSCSLEVLKRSAGELQRRPVPVKSTYLNEREALAEKRRKATGRVANEKLHMQHDYSYRESNWEIGRAAKRAYVRSSPFRKGARFLAWRNRTTRRLAVTQKKALTKTKRKSKGRG